MPDTSTPILLIGSIPLENSEAVFSTVSSVLGSRIKSIPDGETGKRANWIKWQKDVMERTPVLERVQHVSGYGAVQVDLYGEKKDFPGNRDFGPLGYAQAAIDSYQTFQQLQNAGSIAADTRFQVSLPTPFAPLASFIAADSFEQVEPLYVAAMKREVEEILSVVPSQNLAIQWDAALEFAVLEGVFPAPVAAFEPLMERMVELASWVPDDVPLGYHLCYGDAGHKHFKEPDDSALMVKTMNVLAKEVSRPISWFHLPVPIERDDDRYFEPLKNLQTEAEVYLGLVHSRDGVEGSLRRARVAQRHLPGFGIATECGFGRRPADTIAPLLQLQLDVARRLDEIR